MAASGLCRKRPGGAAKLGSALATSGPFPTSAFLFPLFLPPLQARAPSHPIFLLCLPLFLLLLGSSFFFWSLCVCPTLFCPSPYFLSHQTILGPEYICLALSGCPTPEAPASPPLPQWLPAPPPVPAPPSGLSFLLTDGRAASTPSLKQHLIAVFCSWTSKLGLRRCAGVVAARALGEKGVSE